MTREVDLVSYLPPFLAEFKEIPAALEAENPEFVLVWNAAERALKNEFIETADEYGIGRFEGMMHVLPSQDDTLENRRLRVGARWFSTIPYTWRALLQKLSLLCGDGGFWAHIPEGGGYGVSILIGMDGYQGPHLREVRGMLEGVTPANIVLLLHEEYSGGFAASASPRLASVVLSSSFYPQSNIPRLRLGGAWRLDGSRRLSGYDGFGRVDLHPVQARLLASARNGAGASQAVRLASMAGGAPHLGGSATFGAEAGHQPAPGEGVSMASCAPVGVGMGMARMENQNILGGAWRLDGSRRLNGGGYRL